MLNVFYFINLIQLDVFAKHIEDKTSFSLTPQSHIESCFAMRSLSIFYSKQTRPKNGKIKNLPTDIDSIASRKKRTQCVENATRPATLGQPRKHLIRQSCTKIISNNEPYSNRIKVDNTEFFLSNFSVERCHNKVY